MASPGARNLAGPSFGVAPGNGAGWGVLDCEPRRGLVPVYVNDVSSNSAGLIYRTDGLVNEELSCGSRTILGDWRCSLFMIGFHLDETLDCVGLLVIVDDRMMDAAQQDQIVVAVPVSRGLIYVVAGTTWARRFDVADFSDERLTLDDFDGALRECAAVAGPCKQPFERPIGRPC
jgi:hypothetical protein